MTDVQRISFRSLLFVPGSRPERFDKAVASGADVVCVDLEDAVAAADKSAAREAVQVFLEEARTRGEYRAVRINPLASVDGLRDLLMLTELSNAPDLVLLPKVESKDEVTWFHQIVNRSQSLALIETPLGIEQATSIAESPSLAGLMLGAADYCAATGCDMTWEALLYPRSRIVQAAGHTSVAAIDSPTFDLEDESALLEECRRAAALGFVGKPALHPKQVPAIHQGFTPSTEAVERAERIVAAHQEDPDGVIAVDGRMVDAPVVEWAHRTLELARRQ